MSETQTVVRKAAPITTAPRDGSEVLAWYIEGKNWHPVFWKTHERYSWLPPFQPRWAMRWHDEYHQGDGAFSHWMEMPPPPMSDR